MGSPEDSFIAIKGGTPAASHGHMDVGSFVYDAHGLRWICDLGSDNYNLPSYFGSKRWDYFRLQNPSHHTLEINGKLQNAQSKPCPLLSSTLTGSSLAASFDLSGAYSDSAGKVIRSMQFDPLNGTTTLEDQIGQPTGSVIWRAFTDADAEVKGDQVILRKNGSQITLKRISKAGGWSITDAKPPTAEENQNRGFRAVVLTIPRAEKVSARVEIRP